MPESDVRMAAASGIVMGAERGVTGAGGKGRSMSLLATATLAGRGGGCSTPRSGNSSALMCNYCPTRGRRDEEGLIFVEKAKKKTRLTCLEIDEQRNGDGKHVFFFSGEYNNKSTIIYN